MRPHELNEKNLFISGWYMDDNSLCDDIIEYGSNSKNKQFGSFYNEYGAMVDRSIKDSIDVAIPRDTELFTRYTAHLQECVNNYSEQYEYIQKTSSPWTIYENVNIQKYPKGGGYKVWHFERVSGEFPTSHRMLVFLTYLNDVEVEGGTEFYYQNITVKAEKGLTLIWPCEWTHTHRGIVAPKEIKWVSTGWFNFIKKDA